MAREKQGKHIRKVRETLVLCLRILLKIIIQIKSKNQLHKNWRQEKAVKDSSIRILIAWNFNMIVK